MKKFYKILGNTVAMAAVALSVNAQQLPNGGFEEEWGNCTPWTSSNNTKTKGVTPASWTISHVIGSDGTGATEVGQKVEGGYNGSSLAVKLTNESNPLMSSQIVPGYITLGTTWSTSLAVFTTVKNSDGGVFGGIEFNSRPDALSFYYMRQCGDPNAISTIVAYLWKGTWTQKSVPGDIKVTFSASSDKRTKVDMVNRDRSILGMSTDQGGAVEKSDDAELIALLNTNITEDAAEWTLFEQPIEYKSNATPSMCNVIIAAGDYFGGASAVKKGNALTIDDVRFVYYSRLKSLSIAGTPVELEDGKYDYEIAGQLPAAEDFVYELLGQSATAELALDAENNKATVTVSNVDGDSDGEKQHVYNFTFVAPVEPVEYQGYLTINMLNDNIVENQAAKIEITQVSDDKCTFLLPDFAIDLGDGPQTLGDIEVENVEMTTENGVTTYKGHVDNMALLEGQIIADVDVNGTITEDGIVSMDIDVLWKLEDNTTPIKVTFTTNELTFYEPVEYQGYLTINMLNANIVENQAAKIEITQVSDDKCTFLLPDFAIDLGDGPQTLGDIKVDDVEMTTENGVTTYKGHVDNMALLEGQIIADVDVNGTITEEGIVSMDIDVLWKLEDNETPIKVTFTTNELAFYEPVEYQGYLTINMFNDNIVENQAAKIEITQVSDDKCTFLLPDFAIDLGDGPQTLGDIEVENVEMTTENGVTTYKGHVDNMALLEGQIIADVDVNGTITEDGIVSMDIDVLWKLDENKPTPIKVTFTTNELTFYEPVEYKGYLTINMLDANIVENQAAKIKITQVSDDKCTFLLPDFAIDLGDGPQTLGDIEVENVEMTTENGVTTYKGHVDNMALLEGQIIADVDVNGTITEDGIVSMDIDVLWKLEDNETPIKVTFTTDKVAGIASIASEDAQKVEYFNIQGVRVNATDLVPGLYITRQGDKVTKVIVK